ncbi:Ubiquitin carboxyl-terminal hydrolase 8 [Hypsizygus marmoreus]|uniref:ubiquitinyl hydrolase 1 n=1 Tax=Hypsizygus marmoreus TaxID=39966 RepID=A0A369J3X8_HYPMA|nr:Ubiquitin carboxyl-terminal hydrolase 8 [Hypsizygus marmoreus]
MPGVTVLPQTPGLGSFGSPHTGMVMPTFRESGQQTRAILASQNGDGSSYDGMSHLDIKESARQSVHREARGVSPLTLIRTALRQFDTGKVHESNGELKNAFAAYIKAATLAKMVTDIPEKERDAVVRREINDFFETHLNDFSRHLITVETKLKEFEKANPATSVSTDGPLTKSGGSIADRLKALQDHGLAVGTSKRFSRNISELNPPPPSSSQPQPISTRLSTQSLKVSPSPSTSSAPSPHALVSPSSLGPPSPTSSPSSSPQLDTFSLSEFTQAFPTIEEFDAFPVPSPPSGATFIPEIPHPNGIRNGDSPTRSSGTFRNFVMPIERPSSTPIPPVINTFISRPPSPTKPSVPLKPSNLSSSVKPKPIIPVSETTTPKELSTYIRHHSVLLLDVRHRADFEREHINNSASGIACVEPTVLQRRDLNIIQLEEAMLIGPKREHSLFNNREKFDLVVLYDAASTDLGSSDSPLRVLARLIGDRTVQKVLKRAPMLLVGGIEAWRREFGGSELPQGALSPEPQKSSFSFSEVQSSSSSPLFSTSPNSRNPFLTDGLVYSASAAMTTSPPDPHKVWTPSPRADFKTHAFDMRSSLNDHRTQFSLDQTPTHSRSPAEAAYPTNLPSVDRALARRPALSRPSSSSISYTRSNDNVGSPGLVSQPLTNGSTSSITYPQFPRRISPSTSGSGAPLSPLQFDITSPPQASINPSQLSRRRTDYVDQSQEALLTFHTRPAIDYPELSTSQQVLRPPPVAATSVLERQDNRPRLQHVPPPFSPTAPKAPRIQSDYPVTYWLDEKIGISGLKNLGNTCYMNAPIQCLSATAPFASFFRDNRWKTAVNYTNPLGSKGRLAGAFAKLLHEMWSGDNSYLSPTDFRKTICQLKSQYIGSDQHDSQEFLSFLLDGIHEDLNRIMVKPTQTHTPEQEAELERLPPQIASDQEWRAWRQRNDSLIVDFFQGQFRNQLQCMTCHTTSTTYNVFSILQLPIPQSKNGKVPLQSCLEAFFNTEVLEKDDAWDCPKCKAKRRATKMLSLARLPPILLIHLKRFSTNGLFSDKIDTYVDFPMKALDLTGYMPQPLPQGADKTQYTGLPTSLEDPRTQVPPYRYDLYGVTNHYGNLSSGHYTAFIGSRGSWVYCDDSSTRKDVDPKQVVVGDFVLSPQPSAEHPKMQSQKAYVLFYKRTKS